MSEAAAAPAAPPTATEIREKRAKKLAIRGKLQKMMPEAVRAPEITPVQEQVS